MVKAIVRHAGWNARVKFLGSAIKYHATAINNDGARADRFHFLKNVRGQNNGAILAKVAHKLAHLKLLIGVKAVGGLVKTQNWRIM